MRAAISPFETSNINQSSSTLENNSVRPPRYCFNSKPDAFMNNNVWKAAMANIINKIETAQYNQLEIDRRYNDMCYIICKEMDKYLEIKYCSKTQRRHFKISKPYWNNELTQLWKVRVEKENLFLKWTGSSDAKRYCHQEFKLARRNFDKKSRYSERLFLKEQQKSIDKSAKSGDFW